MWTSKSLDRIYRPNRFSEVVGQERTVRSLQSLIRRNKLRRNLLLCGDRGSGKTSLARIYAKALNCQSNGEDGSPCGICANCRDGGGLFEYDTAGKGGDQASIDAFLYKAEREDRNCDVRVLFFDEAHALEPEAADSLLKKIEEAGSGFVYCFATTAPGRLREALVSRLMALPVRALSHRASVDLLQHVANKESIDYDVGALELLAAVKRNYPRDLLIGLEQLGFQGERLTVEVVKDAFGVDQTDILYQYALALADRDAIRRGHILAGWNEDPLSKAEWIRNLFISIYYNNVIGREVVVDPVVHSAVADHGSVVDRFRAQLSHLDDRQWLEHWVGLLQFWADHKPTDDASAILTIALFERRVLEFRTTSAVADGLRDRRAPQAPSIRETRSEDVVGLDVTFIESQSDFLTPSEVREIVNRASYFIQHNGRLFNFALRIEPHAVTEAVAVAECRALIEGLMRAAKLKTPTERDGAIALIEREQGVGVYGAVVGHLGALESVQGEAWLREHVAAARSQLISKEGRVDEKIAPAGENGKLKFHWSSVLNLCASVYDASAPELSGSYGNSILDNLKVKHKDRREPRPITPPRLAFYGSLRDEMLELAQRFRMAFLSPYDDRAFDWIQEGWELNEYEDRAEQVREREGTLASIREWYRNATEREGAERGLMEKWSSDPKRRRRSWQAWWS